MRIRECAAVLGALTAVSAVRADIATYRDWRLVQEEVVDTNANDNVRLHFDMTKPLHGPWLLNPSATSMSVNWITREKCAAGIEWREKGAADWSRRWGVLYGKLDYSKDTHTFHLDGLKPATEYEYRFLSTVDQYNCAYVQTCIGRETYSFRTLDPAKERYTCFFTADIHGSLRLGGDEMFERTGAKDADLYFFLGDNVNDNMNEPRYYVTTGFLDDVVRLWGMSKPTVFVRGNHDCWGRHATEGWAEYYARPDGRGYFTVAQGPALFVVFDMAEEYRMRSAAGREVQAAYRAEQIAWFRALKASEQWKKATFRIAMCHYGTRTGVSNFKETRAWLRDELVGANGVHLFLCGHEHFYARSLPHDKEVFHNARYDRPKAKPHKFPLCDGTDDYTEICGDSREAMMLEVAPDRLVVRSCDFVHPEAGDLDRVEILPDRTARAL